MLEAAGFMAKLILTVCSDCVSDERGGMTMEMKICSAPSWMDYIKLISASRNIHRVIRFVR
jgi:hypothetical protein